MTEQAQCPVGAVLAREVLGHEYDHYDQDFALDPHATYAEMREKCPISFSEKYGGFYVMSTYAAINEVLMDGATFSSFPADTPPTPGHTRRLVPFEVDAPDHRRYRMIIDPVFRPNTIDPIADEIRQYAAELVEAMVAKREFDFMTEFAIPFPSAVFLRMIGLEVKGEVRDQLCEWVGTILHATPPDGKHGDVEAQTKARLDAGKKLHNWLRSVLDEKVEHPGDDLLSMLLSAELPGQRKMDHGEILNFAYVLVLAGLDTVTTAIGFGFLHLAQRPDLQDRLAADPGLIPNAIEELLRYESIVHMSRTVMAPKVIGGVQLNPGDRVTVPLASAHRDGEIYDRPDEIILDRKIEQSMVFGAGSHRCVGSHLARLELNIAFEEILRRIPKFSLPPDAKLYAYGGQTRSLETLPFRTWRED